MKRIALAFWVVVILAGAFGTTSANAQSAPKPRERMSGADLSLYNAFGPKVVSKTVTKAEAIQLFTRGFEYYRNGDYYSAERLFKWGQIAYGEMRWVRDEAYLQADTYVALSRHKFCTSEPTACRAMLVPFQEMDSPANRLSPGFAEAEDANLTYMGLVQARPTAPANLAQELRQECRAAFQRFRKACAAVGDSANACRWDTRPECD